MSILIMIALAAYAIGWLVVTVTEPRPGRVAAARSGTVTASSSAYADDSMPRAA